MAVAGRTQTGKSGKAKSSDSEAPLSFFMMGDDGSDKDSEGDDGNAIASLFLAPLIAPSPRKGKRPKKKLRPRFKAHCFARLLKPK